MFIFNLRFPPGVSIATIMDMYGYDAQNWIFARRTIARIQGPFTRQAFWARHA